MSGSLLQTKLHMPRIRPFLVPRPHLIERLEAGLDGKLSLISAPAGFGKTTLVASFVAACGLPAAWLSLDKDDNQVGRFLAYLLAALQAADPTIGREAAQLIRDARQLPTESMLTPLINDLDAPGGKLLLVLDDYQLISNPAVHEAVAFLLTHSPQRFHLLLAGRSDPPLPLARLRARGQLEEIRAAALRFSEAEAAQFLNDVMGLSLDAASIAALAARTERKLSPDCTRGRLAGTSKTG
jgi:LuxR family maltose regulon positive regulatory protein